jgi:flavin-dependent dehydrogenase
MTQHRQTVVIGGGVAGAATAIRLARAGRPVTLLERDRAPARKVCGEFLTREACEELDDLGVDLDALGAEPIDRLRVHAGRRTAAAALPFPALGLSRTVLDPALRALAADAGAEVRPGARVSSIACRRIDVAGSPPLEAGDIVLATGKHGLRGTMRPQAPRPADARIGFKQHLRLAPEQRSAVRGSVELFLFRGGYAGLAPVGRGLANFSLVADGRRWTAAGRDYAALLRAICGDCATLADRLRGAEPDAARPEAVASIAYGFRVWRSDPEPEWLWRVGDQAAVTPSLAGAGMALALRGARILSRCIVEGERSATYRARLGTACARQLRAAQLVDRISRPAWIQGPVVATAAHAPGLLSLAASLTRLPASSALEPFARARHRG